VSTPGTTLSGAAVLQEFHREFVDVTPVADHAGGESLWHSGRTQAHLRSIVPVEADFRLLLVTGEDGDGVAVRDVDGLTLPKDLRGMRRKRIRGYIGLEHGYAPASFSTLDI
jgi:hypothetical protein